MLRRAPSVLALVLLACSSTEPSIDASSPSDSGLSDSGLSDSGPSEDAAADDAASEDAALADSGESDGGAPGPSCDASAVSFPMGGTLEPGTPCDDVFVCVEDAAGAARVMAASSRFACAATPEGGCSGWTCAYRDPGGPSVLDAAEVQAICAITVLEPPPPITCRVYL